MREGCAVCHAPAVLHDLCARHLHAWDDSGESLRVVRAADECDDHERVAFADFVRRIQAEERNGRHG